jgi:hypothetical protein
MDDNYLLGDCMAGEISGNTVVDVVLYEVGHHHGHNNLLP